MSSESETIREMQAQIDELNRALASLGSTGGTTDAMLRRMNSSGAAYNSSLGSGRRAADDLASSHSRVTEAERALTAETARVTASHAALTQSLNSLGTSAKSFGTALLSAQGGMSKFNSSISSAGDAGLALGKSFGPLGMILGVVFKGFTMVAEQVMKQNDALMAAKDTLADFGAVGKLTTIDIREMGRAAGYTGSELAKWTKITKSLGTDIIGLSSTVNGGTKEFAELTKVTNEQYENYRKMGVSQEELTQNQADYVKLQVQSGRVITEQMKRDGSLKKASIEYTDNLLQLSAITGQTVAESKKSMEQALASRASLIRNQMDEQKAAQLRAAGREDEAKAVEKEAVARDNMLKAIAATGDKEKLAMAQRVLASGTYSAKDTNMLTQFPEFEQYRRAIKQGIDLSSQYGDHVGRVTRKRIGDMGQAGLLAGAEDTTFVGNDEALRWSAKSKGKDMKAARETSGKEIKDAAAGNGPQDNIAASVALIDTAGRITRQALDDATLALNPFAKDLTGLTDVFKGLTSTLEGLGTGVVAITAGLGVATLALAKFAASAIGAGGKGGGLIDGFKNAGKIGKLARLGGVAGAATAGWSAGTALYEATTNDKGTGPMDKFVNWAGDKITGGNVSGNNPPKETAAVAPPKPVAKQQSPSAMGSGVDALLAQIAKGEGTSDEAAGKHGYASGYDVTLGYGAYGGKTDKPLSQMTIGEVKAYQRRMLADPKNKWNSSAVGKYQIVGTTLRELQKELKLSDNDVFNAGVQDKMGHALLNRRGLASAQSGKLDAATFQSNLAKEWASVADSKTGKSAYGQHTGTSADQIQTAMASAGVGSGAAGATPPVSPVVAQNTKPPASTGAPVDRTQVAMVDKLDQIFRVLIETQHTQEKLLRLAQA